MISTINEKNFMKNIYTELFKEAFKYRTEEEKIYAMSYEEFTNNYLHILDKMTSNLEGFYKVRALFILYYRYRDNKTYKEIADECNITASRVQGIIKRSIRLGSKLIYQKNKSKTTVSNMDEPITSESSITRLNLKTRAFTRLSLKGIKTIGELIKYSKDELLMFRNLGVKTAEEIENALNKNGFSLRKE